MWLLGNDTVRVTYTPKKSGIAAKLKVVFRGVERREYFYDHDASSVIPLQHGNGSYEVTLLDNVRDSLYRKKESKAFKLTASDGVRVFTVPNVMVNYDGSERFVKVISELIAGKSIAEYPEIISRHIRERLSYDYVKSCTVSPGYTPDLDIVYSLGKGICYDYSVLFAVMLRSAGVPCKMVFGYANTVYHAWNEVYIGSRWEVYDLTYEDNGKSRSQYMSVKRKKLYEY